MTVQADKIKLDMYQPMERVKKRQIPDLILIFPKKRIG